MQIREETALRLLSSLKNLFFIITITVWATFLFMYVNDGCVLNVDGISMQPTYQDNERVWQEVNPEEINRYDVICFFAPGDKDNDQFIKRVYGLPGETIQIKDNEIYVNGQAIDDPYFDGVMTNYGYASKEIVLGDDEYFVLGDNRNASTDSRDYSCYKIPRALIYSKLVQK